ncbi:MAG: hypothetical protein QOG52_2121 [Frankiaceae bacterium]|nr:hypothetical protein [Frankiaceae bacterium]
MLVDQALPGRSDTFSDAPYLPGQGDSVSVRTSVIAVALASFVTAGCTHEGLVSVTAPTPTGSAIGQCTALLAKLPASVDGLTRRDTSSTAFVAAWGDPTVTLRCGGDVLSPDPTASLVDAGGVTWRVRQAGDVVEWLSENRVTRVEVRVPLSNTAQENVMSDIGNAVRDAIPALPGATPTS